MWGKARQAAKLVVGLGTEDISTRIDDSVTSMQIVFASTVPLCLEEMIFARDERVPILCSLQAPHQVVNVSVSRISLSSDFPARFKLDSNKVPIESSWRVCKRSIFDFYRTG